MSGLKNLFGKGVMGKGAFCLGKSVSKKRSLRPPAFRGVTFGSFGRLCHRMHSPAGAGARRRCAGRSRQLNRLTSHRWGQSFSFPTAKPQIGGAPTRALSPRRCQADHLFPRRSHAGRLFSQIVGQTGRSMIEMLAVLAIMGVLSVVAIAGLTWAFAKYRANNTIHDVHVWELAALDSNQLYDMTTGELVLAELGNTSTHGYPMATQVQDKDVFTLRWMTFQSASVAECWI